MVKILGINGYQVWVEEENESPYRHKYYVCFLKKSVKKWKDA